MGVWDYHPRYRLDQSDLEWFLTETFGSLNFYITVGHAKS